MSHGTNFNRLYRDSVVVLCVGTVDGHKTDLFKFSILLHSYIFYMVQTESEQFFQEFLFLFL